MSPVIYFSPTSYLLPLHCTNCAHTSPILTLLFLCMGISDSDALLMNTQKKRQKLLHCISKKSTKSFSTLKGAVSVDGDSKRSSVVDDLNRHIQPSRCLL